MKDTTPIVQELQNATTIVNCYCPNGWYQYETFAVCVGSLNDKGYQTEAQKACHQEKGGYLATEFDKSKRAFNYCKQSIWGTNVSRSIVDTLTNGGSTTVNSYYNGLMSVNGSWFWDQPKGQPMLPVGQRGSNSDWTDISAWSIIRHSSSYFWMHCWCEVLRWIGTSIVYRSCPHSSFSDRVDLCKLWKPVLVPVRDGRLRHW